MLEVAKTKEDLPPDTDLECPICYDKIDLDKKKKMVNLTVLFVKTVIDGTVIV